MSSLGPLEPYRIEPYRKNAVLAFIATLDKPFLAREVEEGTGLPRETIIRVLTRLRESGLLTRHRVPMYRKTLWRGGIKNRVGGGMSLMWLYRVASWDA